MSIIDGRIDGRKLAKQLSLKTKENVASLRNIGVVPTLVEILVGNDPASRMYLNLKHRKAGRLGIKSIVKRLPADTTQDQLLNLVQQCNLNDDIDGIVVQSPLPKHINERVINAAINPGKDVDGVNPLNEGQLFEGSQSNYPVGCTPKGIMTMLHHYHVPLRGRRVVVIGRSRIVGRPMTSLLINAGALVTDLNHYAKPIRDFTKQADVIISATGHINLLNGDDVKPGVTVIDVGENMNANGKLVGDVNFKSVAKVAGLITPVPGGVGPMTVATLMQQVVDLTEWSRNDD
ncbi:bifunctional 5,10-methylenetetrahydrofolate dehydrogenase/5,10-methenyltetrahydrofolate cyclohydrolase [Acetilactobacillus jinshanensis]|uniref:bifunctional 5,10-methylenetetrahydrofolate dehydrogenase/5,10-methenyltetrahydrofolate cyclohydrolase n=1 Tax=Acetilactobacillus jinshanensis TaxID=1720083 RepID=UPI0026CB4508